jgi:DNA polymerase III subunit chi
VSFFVPRPSHRFAGRDEAALGHARSEWRRLKDLGRTISYWRERDEGGWEQAR